MYPIEIDGSHGEGGGQMLRTAVALSLLTGRPFTMTRIRAGRAKPGLKAQHLHVLQAAGRISGSLVTGAQEGSRIVSFTPRPPRGTTFDVDIGTAGSITLVMQTLLPAMLFADGPSAVAIRGGTDVSMSPTFDYFRHAVLPHAAVFAEDVSVECLRRGFYPRGGGEVRLTVRPRFGGGFEKVRAAVRASLPPLALTEADPAIACDAFSVASEALRPQRVAERQLEGAAAALRVPELHVHQEYVPSLSIGTCVVVVARRLGGTALAADSLGERGKRAEQVGREAAQALMGEIDHGAPVDEHLADHLVPWLALRGGAFRARVLSPHTLTNCWLLEQFLGPTFRIDEARRTVACG